MMSPVQWGVTGLMVVGLCLVVLSLRKQAAVGAGRTAKTGVIGAEAGLNTEMQQMTRAMIDELDRKSRELERLLADADRRIDALRSAPRSEPNPEPLPREDRFAEPRDPLRARVHQLADAGHSPVEIAQAVGCPTGQIELMLALRRAGQ